jgi:hypothetical protein
MNAIDPFGLDPKIGDYIFSDKERRQYQADVAASRRQRKEAGLPDYLSDLDEHYHLNPVMPNRDHRPYFQGNTELPIGYLWWDPNYGLEVPPSGDVEGKGGILTPSECLYHDAAHALLHKRDPNRSTIEGQPGSDPQFDTIEDRKIITGPEREMVEQLGGPLRSSHNQGEMVPVVDGPTGRTKRRWYHVFR